MKESLELRKVKFGAFSFVFFTFLTVSEIIAQNSATPNIQSDGLFDWWTISLFLLVASLIIAVFYRYKTRSAAGISIAHFEKTSNPAESEQKKPFGRDDDLEWLRNNPKVAAEEESENEISQPADEKRKSPSKPRKEVNKSGLILPVFSFKKLKPADSFDTLPISKDAALLNAIEQVHQELEEDEEIRSLSIRILAAFKSKNSIEALSQVALYDLSSNLRSKAITILSEFDHESVFETILMACADPSREVRAAAARALFHLTFDRANAWSRIANSEDEGKMVQIIRAATEAGLVQRSFERLAHRDKNYAYEAFVVVTLLIKTNQMEIITDYLKKCLDAKVRRAILHVVKVSRDKRGIDGLRALLEQRNLSPELQEDVDQTIEEMGFVTV